MSFGYLGDTSTKIKQQVKNQGVISVAEAYELEKAGHLGGSLELIEKQTVSSVSSVDFTSIKQDLYDVHFLTCENINVVDDGQILRMRFSDDGGSSFEVANYRYARQFGNSSGTFGESKATTYDNIELSVNIGNSTNEAGNAYAYLYNLGNSSKYSFMTQQSVGMNATPVLLMHFGGGVYTVASTINGIRLIMSTGNVSGNFSLFGVKQI